MFVNGSSRVTEGKRMPGYAVIDGKNMEIIDKEKLLTKLSAQCCEIYALLKGLQWLRYKKGTIYTNLRYACGVVDTFGKIWEERRFINSKGKTLVHEK